MSYVKYGTWTLVRRRRKDRVDLKYYPGPSLSIFTFIPESDNVDYWVSVVKVHVRVLRLETIHPPNYGVSLIEGVFIRNLTFDSVDGTRRPEEYGSSLVRLFLFYTRHH